MTATNAALSREVEAWLESVHRHIDDLDDALAKQHSAARRVAHAREALEETIAELYGENAIQGKNKEERDACLRRLTAAERYELREAEDALAVTVAAVERSRSQVAKDRQTRYALQVSAMLRANEHPLEAAFERLTRAIPINNSGAMYEFERAG
ncbi:MAG TPA: hypothetical protein VNT60_10655 [Deinococcales bacterium]|nr:hypothetical protein [Deinococcales bacterium]